MTESNSIRPSLWSDFDGTAVAKYGMGHPFNATKYPLPIMPGYIEFLDGFVDAGGLVKGVLTRRGNWRRPATMRSISRLGLESHLLNFPGNVKHFNSDRGKAAQVINDADHGHPRTNVSLIDDKPDVVGMRMVELLAGDKEKLFISKAYITLGAVSTASQIQRIDNLETEAGQIDGVEVFRHSEDSLAITVGQSTIHTTALSPYSFDAGQMFAETVSTRL